MEIMIKCDQRQEGFDFDTCIACKRFTLSMGSKGRNWRCSLNNKTAAEKRAFRTIWTEDFLIERGAMKETSRSTVVVEYVGKKKMTRRPDKNVDSTD